MLGNHFVAMKGGTIHPSDKSSGILYPSTPRHKGNEAKYKILALLEPHERYYSPSEIAELLGMTAGSVRTRLSNFFYNGYIHRRKEYRAKKSKKWYCYRYLKSMGYRVLRGTTRENRREYIGMHERMEIRRVIGDTDGNLVSLKVKDTIPYEIIEKYNKLKELEPENRRQRSNFMYRF